MVSIRQIFLILLFVSHLSVKSQISAIFSATPVSGCAPLVVSFSNTSSGNFTSCTWRLGNGNTSYLTNPQASYLTPGTYTVTLIVTDGANTDSLTIPDFITVFRSPVAGFHFVGQTSGCPPLSVNFLDETELGDAPITQYLWDFGDGYISSIPNPGHLFASPGTFFPTLQVTDANGCSASIPATDPITVFPKPTATFVASQNYGCEVPILIHFTNNSYGTGSLSYSWNFGDGSTSSAANPDHSYNSLGSYDVTLVTTNENGCSDTLIKEQYIVLNEVVADFIVPDTILCYGETAVFMNQSEGASSYSWDFGDGTPLGYGIGPTHFYEEGGIFTASLVASLYGTCHDTATATIVIEKPQVGFPVVPSISCSLPFSPEFSDTSSGGVSTMWYCFYNDSLFHAYDYTPGYTYLTDGTFLVCQAVTSSIGCKDSACTSVIIAEPAPYFSADTLYGCVPITCNFFDLSYYNLPGDSIISWEWSFGDGTYGSGSNPSHSYSEMGQYPVTLTITTGLGCDTSFTRNVKCGILPDAGLSFYPQTFCMDDTIFLESHSTPDSLIDEYFWFVGGSAAGGQSSWVVAQELDTLIITHIVGILGCYDTTYSSFLNSPIVLGPQVLFTVIPNCLNPNEFTFYGTVDQGTSFYWNLGDGTIDSTQLQFTHEYMSPPDFYHVSLEAFNDTNGCDHKLETTVFIHHTGVFLEASVDTICRHTSVHFSANIYYGPPPPYIWVFGTDTIISLDTAMDYTFHNLGLIDVSFTVTNEYGCSTTGLAQILIIGPAAAFSLDDSTGCAPFSVNTINESQGENLIYFWTASTGDTTSQVSPSFSFPNPGVYGMRLTVTDTIVGCYDYLYIPDLIHVFRPTANFYPSSGMNICLDDSVSFVNCSSGVGLQSTWSFGDSDSSGIWSPEHQFSDTGTFFISITVTDTIGCTASMIYPVPVVVQGVPDLQIVADTTTSTCYPFLVGFIAIPADVPGVNWLWNFGDNGSATFSDPDHNYMEPGSYDVSLTATTSFGCSSSVIIPDFIFVGGSDAGFSLSPNIVCIGEPVFFTIDYMTSGGTILWDFGDGNLVPGSDTLYIYGHGGKLYPRLIFSNSDGSCVKYVEDSVSVVEASASLEAADTSVCLHEEIVFQGHVEVFLDQLQTAVFHDGFGNQAPFQDEISYLFQHPGTMNPFLVITTAHGCSDTARLSSPVTVFPLPLASFYQSTTNVGSWFQNIQFADASTPVSEWFWDFGDGTTSGDSCPLHSFERYHPFYNVVMIVADTNGCRDTAYGMVMPDYGFSAPNAFTPNSDGLNDEFITFPLGFVEFSMDIYDRWGEHIFHTDDYSITWNGRYNNKGPVVKGDVYVWEVNTTDYYGVLHKYIGHVTVVR
ncbi:MAG: PKD domain-containing protein [Bacteroidetes bacterium]|nr:PKD domain-containing protein [Bacteroidota bacterium]MBU1719616.1 PKD domain-containing protein [Bacteroidota bacterium]